VADNPEASGKLVAGKFRLTRLLGKGGMGSVWEGVHATLATRVAVKFIDAAHADSAEARSRFENEARAAASLRSKYVVEVYDHGVGEDGRPFIVMEYLEGEPLDRRLDRMGRLPAKDTAFILQQVCRALTKAHAARIVHRDLKPENIFLVWDDEDGADVAKVVDFGIAKFTDGSLGPSSATRTGSVLGTPYYMSPEQARGLRSVDFRTDIWSLGVIAYRCIVGTLPFDGEAIGDLLVKLCTAPIPVPSQVAPDVPPGFDAFIARALARDPAERFQSVQELGASLAAVCGLSVRTYATGEAPQLGANGSGPYPALFAPALSAPAVTQVSPSADVPEAAATGAPLSRTKSAPVAARRSGAMVAAGLAALVVLGIGALVLAKVLAKHDASAESGRDVEVTAAATSAPVLPIPSVTEPVVAVGVVPSLAVVPAPAASVLSAPAVSAPAAVPAPVVAPRPALAVAPAVRPLPAARRNEPAPARKGLIAPKKEIDIGY
jgi:tRNA A-37 threonylcarbamoyl transferase component Bud32